MPVTKPPIVRAGIPAGNYAKGRTVQISQISEHHVVGDARHAISKAQIVGREFSCTFTIAMDGTIFQLVDIEDTPYTDNAWASNKRSITIEHAGGHANFPYTDAMYRSSIHLHAWLFQTYGMLNCVRHRDIPEVKADPRKATACPGGLNVEYIVSEAKKLLEGEPMISDADNEYGRWNKLFYQIRGRNATRDEFRKFAVGKTWLRAMEILSDDKEADQSTNAQVVGSRAIAQNWQGQISDLRSQVEKLGERPTQAQLDDIKNKLLACENDMKRAEAEANEIPETEAEKINFLTRIIQKLFGKK